MKYDKELSHPFALLGRCECSHLIQRDSVDAAWRHTFPMHDADHPAQFYGLS